MVAEGAQWKIIFPCRSSNRINCQASRASPRFCLSSIDVWGFSFLCNIFLRRVSKSTLFSLKIKREISGRKKWKNGSRETFSVVFIDFFPPFSVIFLPFSVCRVVAQSICLISASLVPCVRCQNRKTFLACASQGHSLFLFLKNFFLSFFTLSHRPLGRVKLVLL